MAVSLFLCPSLSVILWGHVRLLACPDVFSYLSAFQQVPSSFPPPLSLFSPSFPLSLSLPCEESISAFGSLTCISVTLSSPWSALNVSRESREERREKENIQIQMKEWRIRRDNVRTQKRTVSLKGKRNKGWVINIHLSCHGCLFSSLARGSPAYVHVMKWSTAVVAILKYNLLSLQSE